MNMSHGKHVLIVTAVPIERDAVLSGLKNDPRFDVLVGGVGPAVAAARTMKALGSSKYNLVISAGIGGGFSGQAELGSLVLANEIVASDLGVETPEGFCWMDELGFGSRRVPTDSILTGRLAKGLQAAGLPLNIGPVLTVSTGTGTEKSATKLAKRIPGAVAEAMEGYGVAVAAQECGVPVLELRAISNLVGPRDRSAWRIKEALDILETACSVLTEVLI